MKNIVVFASGSGTNFESIIDAVQGGRITARIAGLISNKKDIGALQRAEDHEIAYAVIDPNDFEDQDRYIETLLEQLRIWQTDLIVLAGYLKKIPLPVIREYSNRILNIHPSLLPKYGGKGFYGSRVHQAVLNAGEKESGCTVHLVTENYDEGPVLGQFKVPVEKDDTPDSLAQRVLKQEHQLYPKIIQQHLESLND